MLTLSAVDQFHMTIPSGLDKQIVPIGHQHSSLRAINLQLSECHLASVQNQKTMSKSQYTCFISYLSNLRFDIGFIGRFDTLFERLGAQPLRNVVTMIQHHFSTEHEIGVLESSFYADGLRDAPRRVSKYAPFSLHEHKSLDRLVENWIMSARFISWASWVPTALTGPSAQAPLLN
jgi:hypothetical protein